jgi:hypothetical protein
MAGRHPWMLQAMAEAVLSTDVRSRALDCFYERVAFHFEYLWNTMDEGMRTTVLALSLLELDRWAHSKLNVRELEKVSNCATQLDELAELGLAEQVKTGLGQHLLVLHDQRWRVGTQAFAWWLRDAVIAEGRLKCATTYEATTYQEWRRQQRYRLLTQAQMDWLARVVPNTPEWSGRDAESRALLAAWLKGENR